MDVWVVAALRTPFCKASGALETVPAQDLGARLLRELVERSEIAPKAVDLVVTGNVACPYDAANLSRVIALQAGLPQGVSAHTVSRNCASGLEAIVDGARRIQTGEAGLVAALGVESMSRIPVVFPDSFRSLLGRVGRARGRVAKLAAWSGLRPRHLKPVPALLAGLVDPVSGLNMGETAELLAREFGISREAQDGYAKRSHERALAARKRGIWAEETVPLFLGPDFRQVVAEDVGPRPDASLERLQRLRPVFAKRGSVTAGNASLISDGAAGVLLASGARAAALGLRPLARVRSHAVVGLDPRRMGLGPVFAVPPALERAGIRLEQVELIELNEAFAAQVLACLRAFASRDFAERELGRSEPLGELDQDRLNVNGGAIAIGHPVGASGARLVVGLSAELRRRRARFGLATLCVGGGQGQAIVLESAE